MRKKVFGKQLGRNTNTRKALFRALARGVILHGGITTTKAKAKAVQPKLERLASLANKNTLDTRREALSMLGNNREITHKLFENIGANAKKNSGFTRIIALPPRRGDNTKMARIEWAIKSQEPAPAKKADKKEKPKKQ